MRHRFVLEVPRRSLETRARYCCDKLRYPSDLSDAERATCRGAQSARQSEPFPAPTEASKRAHWTRL